MRILALLPLLAVAACSSSTPDTSSNNSAAAAPELGEASTAADNSLDALSSTTPDTSSDNSTAAAAELGEASTAADNSIDALSAIAGLWDASVLEDGAQDIIYAEHKPSGEVVLYDYQDDDLGLGEKCNIIYTAQLTSLGNNQFRAKDSSEVAEMVVRDDQLKVKSAESSESRSMPRLNSLDRAVPICDQG